MLTLPCSSCVLHRSYLREVSSSFCFDTVWRNDFFLSRSVLFGLGDCLFFDTSQFCILLILCTVRVQFFFSMTTFDGSSMRSYFARQELFVCRIVHCLYCSTSINELMRALPGGRCRGGSNASRRGRYTQDKNLNPKPTETSNPIRGAHNPTKAMR